MQKVKKEGKHTNKTRRHTRITDLGLVHTHFVVIGYPVHQVSVNEYFSVDFLKLNKVLMHKNP